MTFSDEWQAPRVTSDVITPPEAPRLTVLSLTLRIIQSFWTIAIVAIVAAAIVVALLMSGARKYDASALLATVAPNRLAGAPALAAALGGLQGSGVQATPALVVELSRTNDVLLNVGKTLVPERGNRRIVDLLANASPEKPIDDDLVGETLQKYFISSADLQTGLVHVDITDRDSVVARRALKRWIEEINSAYRQASQAQARAIAEAQGHRVDSAAAHLAQAEDRLLDFTRGNRATAAYTESALGRTRLERQRDFAQTLYSQAASDRDAAIGRALEETPALIVIDPIPAQLKRKARGTASKALLTIIAVGFLSAIVILARMKLEIMALSSSTTERRFAALFTRKRKATAL